MVFLMAIMDRMFGTVAFGIPLDFYPQWTEMLERHRKHNLFKKDGVIVALGGLTWEKFRDETKDKPLMKKIEAVNNLWNRRPWKDDTRNWGMKDKWATPLEFCYKGGDCEDYAIAKMLTLKELGVDCPMRLVIGIKDGVGHAVLAVKVENMLYILDNNSNVVIPYYFYKNFEPKNSLTESQAWAHLKHLSSKDVMHH